MWKPAGPQLALVLAGLAVAAPAATQTGTIVGTLTVEDRPQRRVAARYGQGAGQPVQPIPPVVYLRGPAGSPAAGVHATMAQEDTAFVPALLVVPVGTTVEFPNQDDFFHNVFSYSGPGRFDLGRYPQGRSKAVTFDSPGVVRVYCEVHESMRAAIIVVENDFWAAPDEDGAFRLENVPTGTFELVGWHADRGDVVREVRVTAGDTTRVELEL